MSPGKSSTCERSDHDTLQFANLQFDPRASLTLTRLLMVAEATDWQQKILGNSEKISKDRDDGERQ